MSYFTLDSLKRILHEDVGIDESTDLDSDILDVPFTDLGYDSLAMIQITIAIQAQQGVLLPDNAPAYMQTPRAAINYVNGLLASA